MFKVLLAIGVIITPISNEMEAFFTTPARDLSSLTIPVDAKCPQWWDMAIQQGWSKQQLPKLDKIMYRESRCSLYAINREDPMRGSWGLMQVNGFWVDYLSSRGVLKRLRDLQDPSINLRSALSIYNYAHTKHGNGWGPWGE
jgi:hypothetical protein